MINVFIRNKNLVAPVSGRVVAFNTVPNFRSAFRKNMDGVAIIPTDTKIYAPIDGAVTVKRDCGVNAEILVNPAFGAIELRGCFKSGVKKGTKVRAGDLIAEIDLASLQGGDDLAYVIMFMPKRPAVRIDREWVQGGESYIIKIRQ